MAIRDKFKRELDYLTRVWIRYCEPSLNTPVVYDELSGGQRFLMWGFYTLCASTAILGGLLIVGMFTASISYMAVHAPGVLIFVGLLIMAVTVLVWKV